jgi:hypothetical protein
MTSRIHTDNRCYRPSAGPISHRRYLAAAVRQKREQNCQQKNHQKRRIHWQRPYLALPVKAALQKCRISERLASITSIRRPLRRSMFLLDGIFPRRRDDPAARIGGRPAAEVDRTPPTPCSLKSLPRLDGFNLSFVGLVVRYRPFSLARRGAKRRSGMNSSPQGTGLRRCSMLA